MATTTTNLGLTKPAYSDTADIAVINANMDKIDTAANGLEAGIAIVSNNNTHAAVSKGQYVYVRNHGTLSEGVYKANSNIAANGTLSGSNLTAVSGGLGADVASNADAITTLNGKMAYKKNNVASSDSSNPVNWNNLPIGSVTQVAGSNNVNAPSASFYGIVETFAPMEVIADWSYIMQKAYSFGTSAINHVYVRASNNGGSSWMGWTTIL